MKRLDPVAITRMADEIRAILGEDCDLETLLDTLDGQTDALDILDQLIAQDRDAAALATAIKAQISDLTARKARMEARSRAAKAAMLTLLDAVGARKIERPAATVSRRSGSASVVITDETAVPSQLCQIRKVPDKKAIKAQIDAGEDVPGAEIKIGADGVTLRSA
jgi:hypothetical protein